jgi:hypothetical protein
VKETTYIPRFVSIVAIALGCLDLVRGFMHTILLEYAALNIAGFDLSISLAGDLLQIMGAFGISNYVTGAALILVGWKARPLALVMLGIFPVAYAIGAMGIKANSAGNDGMALGLAGYRTPGPSVSRGYVRGLTLGR